MGAANAHPTIEKSDVSLCLNYLSGLEAEIAVSGGNIGEADSAAARDTAEAA